MTAVSVISRRPDGPRRYRLEVRLSAGDTGSRVVIRWRRPAGDGDEIADILGVLAAADAASFTVGKVRRTGDDPARPRAGREDHARGPASRAGNRQGSAVRVPG